MKQAKHDIHWWLLLSLAIAFVIQVVGVILIDPIGKYDSKEYLSISGSLFNGKGYATTGASFKGFELFEGETPTRMRQPGYPLYLVLFYWLLGENILVLQFSQIVLNALTLYLMFLIASKSFGKRLWGGTLIVLALYFPLWLTSVFVLTETLFTFLLVTSMFLLQRAIYLQEGVGCFAPSGALLGIAFLTRAVALPVCLLSFLPIWLRVGLRKALWRWSVLFMAFCVVVIPWFFRNALVLGDYTPLSTDGGHGFWASSIKGGEPTWLDSPEFRSAVQEDYYHGRGANARFIKLAIGNIQADPLGYLARSAKRVLWIWSYFAGSGGYRHSVLVFGLSRLVQIALLFFAFFSLFAASDVKDAVFYFLPAGALSCAIAFHTGVARYIVPAMPFILVLSGQGLWLVVQRLFKIVSSRSDS